jgi:hypothetical protein
MSMRADLGAARKGHFAIRWAIIAAIRSLGSDIAREDIVVYRRRNMFDLNFLWEGGTSGMIIIKDGRFLYRP